MTKKMEVYRCSICGNIVEVLHAGAGQLVCCGKEMELLEAKSEDQGMEKHVPVIEETANGILVKVGSIPHPMEEQHYIEWIEVITKDDRVQRKHLAVGMKPEAEFSIPLASIAVVREHCNIHGLWKKEG